MSNHEEILIVIIHHEKLAHTNTHNSFSIILDYIHIGTKYKKINDSNDFSNFVYAAISNKLIANITIANFNKTQSSY